jgi:sugar diacid utilization regulator
LATCWVHRRNLLDNDHKTSRTDVSFHEAFPLNLIAGQIMMASMQSSQAQNFETRMNIPRRVVFIGFRGEKLGNLSFFVGLYLSIWVQMRQNPLPGLSIRFCLFGARACAL